MERISILIVEDEETQRSLLEGLLNKEGYRAAGAGDGKKALQLVKEGTFEIVLLDYKLPDTDGLSILKSIKEMNPEIEVIMITAFGSIENAVTALKAGAFEYLTKPIDLDDLLFKIRKVEERLHLIHENMVLKEALKDKMKSENIVYASEKMHEIVSLIVRVAKTDSTCLVRGESGVGKEIVANLIHGLSERSQQALVKVNCSAIPDTLLESELFGYERGAFTGAYQKKIGKFEIAHKGTIFLDEIGDVPIFLQPKLLRVLQEREIERLGGLHPIKVDVRIVAATNKNLEEEVKQGRFREDLFYRLNIVQIEMPPLRERKEDIPLLLDFFLKKFNERHRRSIKGFAREARDVLIKYDYPGNVRELENVVERAIVLARGEYITREDLSVSNAGEQPALDGSLKQEVEFMEKRRITEALVSANWVQTKAAETVGISERMLRYKMKKLGIAKEE
ncbi:MAG TPA: sigma-54 dependent transcriptional regulator [Syntrophorhabdales bacterium]|nr:sigma-54 dependent transcriptional regulator [Syntrophorhabdales bacterium]